MFRKSAKAIVIASLVLVSLVGGNMLLARFITEKKSNQITRLPQPEANLWQVISPNFTTEKQGNGVRRLAQLLEKNYPDIWAAEKGEDKHKITKISQKFPQYITNEILQKAMEKEHYSLFEKNSVKNPLTYKLVATSKDIYIAESTEALYYIQTPEKKFLTSLENQILDFKIVAAVNFGLRGYLFNKNGEVEREWGDYNTAYISTAYHEKLNLIAWSIPGHKKITLVNAKNFNVIKEFEGFSSEVVTFDSQHLYFFNRVGNKSDLYKVNLNNLENVNVILENWDIQYARGLIVNEKENLLYISDTFNNRILVVDLLTSKIKDIRGLKMPNNISLTEKNTLLVADEHNDTVRELNSSSFEEIHNFSSKYLRSPGDVKEIRKGNYKGCWLIADTDNNRIILVDPKTYQIYFEIRNLRSVQSIDIIYD